jgi:hypothetical protein
MLLGSAAIALGLSSCQEGGNFTLFGYTTQPNYRPGIHTVRVPIFYNRTYFRGLEFQLTEAVIHEIESKTPYKVVSCNQAADTELTGTILSYTKGLLNVNNVNEQRDVEITLAVEFTWRDLRTGEALSKAPLRPGEIPAPPPTPLQMPDGPPGTVPPPVITAPIGPTGAFAVSNPDKVVVSLPTHYIPELGQSQQSSFQDNTRRLAREIVHLMETPWTLPCPQ